jgi:hypothetical protein
MKPQLPSRAPLVVDRLVALFRDAFSGHQRLEVVDGPPVGPESALPDDVIAVGYGTPDIPGVEAALERVESLGRVSYVESVITTIVVSSYSGDEDMGARRAHVADLLAIVKTAIDDNQIVADVWDEARIGDRMSWYPTQNQHGCSCEVGFTIVTRSVI